MHLFSHGEIFSIFQGENNEIRSSGAVGGSAGLTNIILRGFGDPSPIDNSDFPNDLPDGLSATKMCPAFIEGHQEDVGPPNPFVGSGHRFFFSNGGLLDMDLFLDTAGIYDGERIAGLVYDASVGSTPVNLRHRLITSEVPKDYFGSEYNDYYHVSLRSQNYGDAFSEIATINRHGPEAFDKASGETRWRIVWLALDPSGDRAAIAVANVADEDLDTRACVDRAEDRNAQLKSFE